MTVAAGYIGDVTENVSVPNKGKAPLFWYGTTPPDGGASPWRSAPVGSLYIYKGSEVAIPVLFFKVDSAETDDDWGSVGVGRTITGGPLGLLLLLTKN